MMPKCRLSNSTTFVLSICGVGHMSVITTDDWTDSMSKMYPYYVRSRLRNDVLDPSRISTYGMRCTIWDLW
jgi:hypothetical protein